MWPITSVMINRLLETRRWPFGWWTPRCTRACPSCLLAIARSSTGSTSCIWFDCWRRRSGEKDISTSWEMSLDTQVWVCRGVNHRVGWLPERREWELLSLLQKTVESGVRYGSWMHRRDDRNLLYQYILNWDIVTNQLCACYCCTLLRGWRIALQVDGFEYITLRDEGKQVIAFEKAGLLFVFNFHSRNSYSDYYIPVRNQGPYRCILSVFCLQVVANCRVISPTFMVTIVSHWPPSTRPKRQIATRANSSLWYIFQHFVSMCIVESGLFVPHKCCHTAISNHLTNRYRSQQSTTIQSKELYKTIP